MTIYNVELGPIMVSLVSKVFGKAFEANVINNANCRKVEMVAKIMKVVLQNYSTQKDALRAANLGWFDRIDENRIKKIHFWYRSHKRCSVPVDVLVFETL